MMSVMSSRCTAKIVSHIFKLDIRGLNRWSDLKWAGHLATCCIQYCAVVLCNCHICKRPRTTSIYRQMTLGTFKCVCVCSTQSVFATAARGTSHTWKLVNVTTTMGALCSSSSSKWHRQRATCTGAMSLNLSWKQLEQLLTAKATWSGGAIPFIWTVPSV